MLSITKASSGQAGRHVEFQPPEYYPMRGESPGSWTGQGAEHLQLSGEVVWEAFKNVCTGLMPDGQRPMAPPGSRQVGSSRTHEGQIGWNLLFSVPDPVSIVGAIGPYELRHKIKTVAVPKATQKALDYLQDHAAFTRPGYGESRRQPAQLVVATFQHSTDRTLAPKDHVHCLVMNLCIRSDGTTGTLDSRPLYKHKMAAGAVFRAVLAQEMERLGYRCTRRQEGFRIKGITDQLCDHFSKPGRFAEAEKAALTTWPLKGTVWPNEPLLQVWRAAAENFGVTPQGIAYRAEPIPERTVAAEALIETRANPRALKQVHDLFWAGLRAYHHQFDGVCGRYQTRNILRHALDASIGTNADLDLLMSETETIIREGTAVRYIPVVTKQVLSREGKAMDVLNVVRRLSKDRSLHVPNAVLQHALARYSRSGAAGRSELRRDSHCNPTGKARQLLDGHGRGLVGRLTQRSGRATVISERYPQQTEVVLRAASAAWREAGYKVIASASSREATEALSQRTGIPGMTHRSLQMQIRPTLTYRLWHHTKQLGRAAGNRPIRRLEPMPLDSSKVLIVTEAERFEVKQLYYLLHDVETRGGKIILLTSDINREPAGWANPMAVLLHELSGRELNPQKGPDAHCLRQAARRTEPGMEIS
jgi:conjugative relaxase-like TrwC/TraI family protein